MDIYDLIEALGRRKRFLIIGFMLLVLLIVVAMFKVETGSLQPRFAPRYETTVQMVVVPEQVAQLTDPSLTSPAYDTVADVYADLVGSRRAGDEIIETTGARIDGFEVFTSNNSPIISVVVESPTADEATTAALGAFHWLVDRLKLGATVAAVSPPEVDTGAIDVSVSLQVEPRFDDVDSSYWFDVQSPDGSSIAMPLYALRTGSGFKASLEGGDQITITVGPEIGAPFDTAVVTVPDLDEEPHVGITLEILVSRGALLFGLDDQPTLNQSAMLARWDNPTDPTENDTLTVMLLNEEPSAVQIGQRRGPILGTGVFIAGLLALLAITLMVDAFGQRKKAAELAAPIEAVPPTPIIPAREELFDEEIEEVEQEEEQDDFEEVEDADDGTWSWERAAGSGDEDAHPWSAQSS